MFPIWELQYDLNKVGQMASVYHIEPYNKNSCDSFVSDFAKRNNIIFQRLIIMMIRRFLLIM